MKKILLFACMALLLAACGEKIGEHSFFLGTIIDVSVLDEYGNDLLDPTKNYPKSLDVEKTIIDDGQKRDFVIEVDELELFGPDEFLKHDSHYIKLHLNSARNGFAETVVRWSDNSCDTVKGYFDKYSCRKQLWVNGKEYPNDVNDIVFVK